MYTNILVIPYNLKKSSELVNCGPPGFIYSLNKPFLGCLNFSSEGGYGDGSLYRMGSFPDLELAPK